MDPVYFTGSKGLSIDLENPLPLVDEFNGTTLIVGSLDGLRPGVGNSMGGGQKGEGKGGRCRVMIG